VGRADLGWASECGRSCFDGESPEQVSGLFCLNIFQNCRDFFEALQQQIEDLKRAVPLFCREMFNLRINEFESARKRKA
jgi:molybdopterin synthase catalytic subunit